MTRYAHLLAIFCIFLISACSAADSYPNAVVGTWVGNRAGDRFTYVFNADGTGSVDIKLQKTATVLAHPPKQIAWGEEKGKVKVMAGVWGETAGLPKDFPINEIKIKDDALLILPSDEAMKRAGKADAEREVIVRLVRQG